MKRDRVIHMKIMKLLCAKSNALINENEQVKNGRSNCVFFVCCCCRHWVSVCIYVCGKIASCFSRVNFNFAKISLEMQHTMSFTLSFEFQRKWREKEQSTYSHTHTNTFIHKYKQKMCAEWKMKQNLIIFKYALWPKCARIHNAYIVGCFLLASSSFVVRMAESLGWWKVISIVALLSTHKVHLRALHRP